MTNLIASIVITLTVVTNWTGHHNKSLELGYIVTNHVANLTYEGETHAFQLKSVPSENAVWRPRTLLLLTNAPGWFNLPGITNLLMTNYIPN